MILKCVIYSLKMYDYGLPKQNDPLSRLLMAVLPKLKMTVLVLTCPEVVMVVTDAAGV